MVRVYSRAKKEFVDYEAVLVEDSHENAISIDVVKTLGLDLQYEEDALSKYGRFQGKHVCFKGTTVLTWSWKEAPLSGHSNNIVCHIIPYEVSAIVLRATLYTRPWQTLTRVSLTDALTSTPSTPSFGRDFGGPLHPSWGSSPPSSSKTMESIAGSPGLYRDISPLGSGKTAHIDGIIDDSGSLYEDITNESVIRLAYSVLL
jgi:hypothetical protein